MTFSTLPRHQVTEGAAVFTLMRNFGSSLFISLAVLAIAIPGQVREAWAISRPLQVPADHARATAVAVLGMGGSAIGGDLVRATWSDRLRLPVEVVRGYDLPACQYHSFDGEIDALVVTRHHQQVTRALLVAQKQVLGLRARRRRRAMRWHTAEMPPGQPTSYAPAGATALP